MTAPPTAPPPLTAGQVLEVVQRACATVLEVDRDVHDRAVASASHLPYVAAHALVGALGTADLATGGVARQLAATGFRSSTRLAGGDVAMWRDILVTNADHVRAAIEDARDRLDEISAVLDDPDALERLLVAGRSAHEPYRSTT